MDVSVIIPAYNEEFRIVPTLYKYARALAENFAEFEILVVANGCRDRTVEIVRNIRMDIPQIKVINIPEAVGKGGAVLNGFRYAGGELIAFVDADGATDAQSLVELLEQLSESDLVIGSRRHPRSIIEKRQPLKRRILSEIFNIIVRCLFGLQFADTQCGAKAFKSHVAKSLAVIVKEQHWAFDVDLLLCAQGNNYQIAEWPVIWHDESGSKLNVKRTTLQLSRSFLNMFQRHHRVFGYY